MVIPSSCEKFTVWLPSCDEWLYEMRLNCIRNISTISRMNMFWLEYCELFSMAEDPQMTYRISLPQSLARAKSLSIKGPSGSLTSKLLLSSTRSAPVFDKAPKIFIWAWPKRLIINRKIPRISRLFGMRVSKAAALIPLNWEGSNLLIKFLIAGVAWNSRVEEPIIRIWRCLRSDC